MPCSPGKARRLLKSNKAKVIRFMPFTIQLTECYATAVEALAGGLDPGEKIGVVAASEKGKVYLHAEVSSRSDEIGELLYLRKSLRRGRRYRKTRYRKARFLNRRKRIAKAPTIRQLAWEHQRVVKLVEKTVPMGCWTVEIPRFDTQKMAKPKIQGLEYQQGVQQGFADVREYILYRDGYGCTLCSATKNLQVHHISARKKRGSDRPANLITLCHECHEKITRKEIKNFEGRAKEYLRWAGKLNGIRRELPKMFAVPTRRVNGKETKERRETLHLEKSHVTDALAMALKGHEVREIIWATPLRTGRFVRVTERQLHRTCPQKGGSREYKYALRKAILPDGTVIRRGDIVRYKGRTGFVASITRHDLKLKSAQGNMIAQAAWKHCKKVQNRSALVIL